MDYGLPARSTRYMTSPAMRGFFIRFTHAAGVVCIWIFRESIGIILC